MGKINQAGRGAAVLASQMPAKFIMTDTWAIKGFAKECCKQIPINSNGGQFCISMSLRSDTSTQALISLHPWYCLLHICGRRHCMSLQEGKSDLPRRCLNWLLCLCLRLHVIKNMCPPCKVPIWESLAICSL